MYYHEKTFTTTVSGRRTVPVACEKCGYRYYFELARQAVGKGSAPYYLFQKAAKQRSVNRANKLLAKKLARESELVPCPQCHWINEELIDGYFRSRRRTLPWVLIILVASVLIIPVVAMLPVKNSNLVPIGLLILVAVVAGLMALMPVTRMIARARLRPNTNYPNPPKLPPGTPPALVEQTDPVTGRVGIGPATTTLVNDVLEGEWAILRPGQLRFPSYCCACLAPATTVAAVPIKWSENSGLKIPMCAACRAKMRRSYWELAVLFSAFELGVMYLIASNLPKGVDEVGRWAIFGVAGFFGVIFIGLGVPALIVRPYRLRTVDRSRSIIRFAARNPRYTAMIAAQVLEEDGVVAPEPETVDAELDV